MYLGTQTQSYRNLYNSVDECKTGQRICQDTAVYSMRFGGAYDNPAGIRLLVETAHICGTVGSTVVDYALCAEMCERSALYCDTFSGDSVMRMCADSCRRTAAYCRQNAGMHI